MQQVSICQNIWKLGECKREQCPSRHVFAESDRSSFTIAENSLIQFKLISVKSPTSFVIKIESLATEKMLEKDLQEYFSDPSNHKPAEANVDDLCCFFTDNKWHRCKVFDRRSVTSL